MRNDFFSIRLLSLVALLSSIIIFGFKSQQPDIQNSRDEKVNSKDLALKGTIEDSLIVKVLLDNLDSAIVLSDYEEALVIIDSIEEIRSEFHEKTDIEIVEMYYLKGDVYLKKNDFENAFENLNIYLELLDVKEDSIRFADAYYTFGIYYSKQGQYDRAKKYYFDALHIYRSRLGEMHAKVGASYHNIGFHFQQVGNFEKALEFSNKALEVRLKVLSENHHDIGMTYHNIGNVYLSMHDYERALEFTQKGLDVRFKSLGQNNPLIGDSYINLGIINQALGKTLNILENYDQALNIYLNKFGRDHNRVATVLQQIGFFYASSGDLKKGIDYLEQALVIKKKVYPHDHIEVGITYYNLSSQYSDDNNIEKSIIYAQKALNIFSERLGPNHPYIPIVLNSIGNRYIQKNDYPSALRYVKNALKIKEEILDKKNFSLSHSYASLGHVYHKMEEYDKAILFYKKGEDIVISNFGNKHQDIASFQHNYGKIKHSLKLYEEAITFINRSISIRLNSQSPNFKEVINSYLELASVYESKESLTEAIEINDEILRLLSFDLNKEENESESGIYLSRALSQRARILEQIDIDENLLLIQRLQEKSFYSLIDTGKKYQNNSFKQEIINSLHPITEQLLSTNNRLFRKTNDATYNYKSFEAIEQGKALILKGAQKKNSIRKVESVPVFLTDKEKEIKVEIAQLEKECFQEIAVSSSENSKDSIFAICSTRKFDLLQSLDSIYQIFKSDYPEYYSITYNPIDKAAFSNFQENILSVNQSLLNYFVGEEKIFIFIVQSGYGELIEIEKDFPLEELVEKLRQSIYFPFSNPDLPQTTLDSLKAQYARVAHQLYQKLLAPIEKFTEGNDELIIVPDGLLGYIPFDALLTSPVTDTDTYRDYPYLLKKYQTSFAYSATLLQEMQNKEHFKMATKDFLGVAPLFRGAASDSIIYASRYIDYADERNRLGALKENRAEVINLQKILGGDLLIDTAATEYNFTQVAGDYRILHLSTHGKANDKVGDYSFLAFYELEDSIENEWLYNRELYELELNADMVVLSACETGIGELQRGEGIISLARGFSYAGAKSIITSLWNVNDKTTPELMNYFYSNLKKGHSKDQALREAKLTYISSSTPNPEPYFWAAFIPIGDMKPIKFQKNRYLWACGGTVLILLSLFFFYRRKVA